jgi:hypothetical protein
MTRRPTCENSPVALVDPMPLTLRPTGLSGNPHRNDWSIHEDGVEIGRLYEDLQGSRPEIRWFWSIS